VKAGWEFKRLGPLFWPMPVFTPQGGHAKVELIEGSQAYKGKQCLCIETTDRECSLYIPDLLLPGFSYELSFFVNGQGQISVWFLRLPGTRYLGSPVFVTVDLTKQWKGSRIPVGITSKEATNGSIVLNVKPHTRLLLDALRLEKRGPTGDAVSAGCNASAVACAATPEVAARGISNGSCRPELISSCWKRSRRRTVATCSRSKAAAAKIAIRGSTGVAIAAGWNWYLKYYCHLPCLAVGQQPCVARPVAGRPEKKCAMQRPGSIAIT